MQKYTHDYTMPSEIDDLLFRAQRLMANECYQAATERINEARQILQLYLSNDNMIPDDDTEDGWVHYRDVLRLIEKNSSCGAG